MINADLFRHSRDSRAFSAGEVFFRDGDEAGRMFVVLDGEVELRRGDRVLQTVHPSEVFGEMELVERTSRWCTAVAVSDGTIVAVDEKQFNFLVANTPHFATELLRQIVERLRSSYEAA